MQVAIVIYLRSHSIQVLLVVAYLVMVASVL